MRNLLPALSGMKRAIREGMTRFGQEFSGWLDARSQPSGVRRAARRCARLVPVGDNDPVTSAGPVSPTGSADLFARAQRVTPGGVNSPVRAFKAVGGTPRFIRSDRCAWLTDVDGKDCEIGRAACRGRVRPYV